MGQYYNILTNKNNEYKVYDRSIKRENEELEKETKDKKNKEKSKKGKE